MKKLFSLLLAATLFLLPCTDAAAWHSFRNETGTSAANTICAQTPLDTTTTGPKWRIKLSQSTKAVCNSSPILTDQHIFIVCEKTLFQLDKDGNIVSTLTLEASMNSVCQMALHENRLFIPLGGGMIQCVDIDTMTSLWKSEAFGLQSLTTVCFYDGYLYAGTTNAAGTDGLYYCLQETDGQTIWTYKNETPCGYYWSGALPANLEHSVKCLLFGGDDGTLVSHSLTDDTIYDTFDLSGLTGSAGKIRAGITWDPETNAYYTTSNNGYLYQIKLKADGHFDSVTSVFLGDTPSALVNCTSTPTIYNGRIYVCSYYNTSGMISVIDAVSMKRIYSATASGFHDIKSSPLVSTGYANEENDQSVYVYFTQNASPGGIYYIRDHARAASAELQTLYEPKNNPQFCMASIVADPDGTLYYSNDSGTFFAIAEGFSQNDILAAPPSETEKPVSTSNPDTSPSQTPATPPTQNPDTLPAQNPDTPAAPAAVTVSPQPQAKNNSARPQKPQKIKVKGKLWANGTWKITLSWKKGKNTKKTLLKIKGKKKRLLSGTKTTLRLKKGTYTIRLYGYRTAAKKSGAVTLRLKLSKKNYVI
ncbi:MAG: hypothetical protein NC293_13185 [Roseburia sp.]|nr:hypothetical protein [Roseburia sp.]